MIKFSIGIPAFKSNFLVECIDSVLCQTYKNFELIIVDDCSPEPIKEIVSNYSDNRIIYSRNTENTGLENIVDNWNNCLKRANGDYFVLMGDDDTLEPNYLQEFIKLISLYPELDIYHCRSKVINENSIPFGITTITPDYENIYDFILSCIKQQRQQYITDFVYRTSALKEKGGFYKLPLAWASDYLSAYIACSEKGIAHTNKILFNYRMNQYSITSSGTAESIILKRKATIAYENWIAFFLQKIPTTNDDIIKRSLIQEALIKHSNKSKVSVVRQLLGQPNIFTGMITVLKARKVLPFTFKEVLTAYSESILNKIHR